jgi:BirA family biotin operon repressor/biotin-[acetyl-CoA-carboxylase] ligase
MKAKILELLKSTDAYISGQELCERFGVSRTAVWKVICQLREEGYVIDSVNRKGYKIISCPDILSEEEILSSLALHEADHVKHLIYLPEVDSTNTRAKLEAEHGAPDWTLVVADRQISGKGRRGRSFDSPGGVGIFMTLLLKPDFSPNKASMLTLLSGMAVCEGLKESTGLETMIKWPNDLVVNGKKVCGILTEMSAEIECINYVIIGIGINVNNTDFPPEIANVATSVQLETGKQARRSDLIACVVRHLKRYYDIFQKTGDLSLLKDEYNRHMINKDRKILVVRGDESFEAVAKSIDDDGELIIERDGKLSKVISGEVSVRGVYGYV